MSKRITFNVLYSSLKEGEYPIIDKESKIVAIVNIESEHKRLYRITRDYPLELEEINIDLDKLAERIAVAVDKKVLIKEALLTQDGDTLIDIDERLTNDKASVKAGPGCFSIKIGGKRGRPIEVVLIQ